MQPSVMKDIRGYNRVAAIFFLCIGVFFTLYARRVEIGTWTEPGPGFLPFWAGLTLTIMSIALLIGSYGKKAWQAKPSFFPKPDSWKRVLATFLSLIVYNLLLTPVGFTLTTFFFLTFLVKWIFPQSWKRTLTVSICGSLFARLLFIHFLETQLPKGFLGF
jgi:putative tricarboxylic transport membrane protein